MKVMLFLVKKFPGEKKKFEMVRYCDTIASFFCHQNSRQNLHTFSVTVKHDSSMWNCLFGLAGQIHCEQSL
jgi:hypothetical protein